jgi:hypothetical protein
MLKEIYENLLKNRKKLVFFNKTDEKEKNIPLFVINCSF